MRLMWRDIKGYQGYYRISNHGLVRSVTRRVKFGNTYREVKGKIIKPYANKKGYLYVTLCRKNICKKYRLHRLIAETFIYVPNNKLEVNHKDGDKSNNRADNLEWVTPAYNSYHRDNILGKHNRGERCGTSKLKASEVFAIKVMLMQEWSQKELAEIFNVDQSTISNINTRKSWV